MSALYLVLARVLYARRREDLRLLVEAFLALGVVFATLAIPLAVDARWTSATWALEGAAIVWVGVRAAAAWSRARSACCCSSAPASRSRSASSMLVRHVPERRWPLANSEFVGAVLVALGGLVHRVASMQRGASAVTRDRARGSRRSLFGVGRRCGGSSRAATRSIASSRRRGSPPRWSAFARGHRGRVRAGGTAAPLADGARAGAAARRRRCSRARLLGTAAGIGFDWHLFAHGGFLAWPIAIAVYACLLLRFEREGAYRDWTRWILRVRARRAAVARRRLSSRTSSRGWSRSTSARDGIWTRRAVGPRAGARARARLRPARVAGAGRSAPHRRAYLVVGAVPLVLWMLAWALLVGIASDGDPAPLPYLPLVNPVDLTQARSRRADDVGARARAARASTCERSRRAEAVIGVPAVLAFLWINAIALRTLHHWFDVPWTPDALWRSTLVQAVLSLLWTLIALATMVVANRMRLARRLDRRRGAARRRRGEAVPGRPVAGRRHRAHRVVHRRRPAAAADRLSRAGAAAAQGGRAMKRSMMAGAARAVACCAAHAQAPADFAWRRAADHARATAPSTASRCPPRCTKAPCAPISATFASSTAPARSCRSRSWRRRRRHAPRRRRVALPLFPLRVDRDRRDLGDLTLTVRRDAAGHHGEPRDARRRDRRGRSPRRVLLDASGVDSPLTALTLQLPDGASVSTRVRVEGSDDLATGACSSPTRRCSPWSSAAAGCRAIASTSRQCRRSICA